MTKTMMRGSIILAIVFSSLLLVTSCAKKQIGVSERIQKPGVVEEERVVVVEEEKQAPGAEEKVVVVVEEEEKVLPAALKAKILEFNTENIYFAFDKSDLDSRTQAILKKKAAFLREDSSAKVLIGGNCDERGTEAYNLALGERRAHSAKNFLMALGISGDRISTVSYGEERPADPAHTPTAWALNRRDTFRLFK